MSSIRLSIFIKVYPFTPQIDTKQTLSQIFISTAKLRYIRKKHITLLKICLPDAIIVIHSPANVGQG
mgnify:CR=1 FL=1